MKKLKSLVIEEWWETPDGEPLEGLQVTAYFDITPKEMREIEAQADKYSLYDYLDFNEFDSREEAEKCIKRIQTSQPYVEIKRY